MKRQYLIIGLSALFSLTFYCGMSQASMVKISELAILFTEVDNTGNEYENHVRVIFEASNLSDISSFTLEFLDRKDKSFMEKEFHLVNREGTFYTISDGEQIRFDPKNMSVEGVYKFTADQYFAQMYLQLYAKDKSGLKSNVLIDQIR